MCVVYLLSAGVSYTSCISAVAVLVYVRYREIDEIDRTGNYENVKIMNKRSVWLGVAASFGVSIVGNFQETNAFVIHVFGAGLAFGVGTVYICIQVREYKKELSRAKNKLLNNRKIQNIRYFLLYLPSL